MHAGDETAPAQPNDDDLVSLPYALEWQREHVEGRGNPVAGLILEAVLDDVQAGGPLAGILPTIVRFGDHPSLRVLAAVHRLALERRASGVAVHLPTLGGTPPHGADGAARFRSAVVSALIEHQGTLRASLDRIPQTNETGRAALLRCALSRLDPTVPVRLCEVGASAGLNLRADHLPGLPGLERGVLPPVRDRLGCDLNPIDPTTTEGRVTLSSYVWVDDVERFQRLGRALEVASRVPATVVTMEATEFLHGLTLEPGCMTVVWHSAFLLYLPLAARIRLLEAIDRLGVRAAPARGLAHVAWEWSGPSPTRSPDFALEMRTWTGAADDGVMHVVATGDSHGRRAELAHG